MSRGIGRIQQMCLAVLQKHGHQDSISLAAIALGKQTISYSESASFRRALRQLARQGLVVDMGRDWRWGRRGWGLPEQAEAYRRRVEKTFGT